MDVLLRLEIGAIPLVPALLVLALLAPDVSWVLRAHRQGRLRDPGKSLASELGYAVGIWLRTSAVALAGAFAVSGSLTGFALFAAGTIWRAIGHGRNAAAGFLSGFQDATGRLNPVAASAFGAAWVAITRGIPLAVLYWLLHAA